MYTVRIEDSFSAAHFLPDYHGKCENLHGHNYRVRVHARGQTLGKDGMLVDFGILKKSLKLIFRGLDHKHLNEHPFFADKSPSAENIAFFIHMEMNKRLRQADIYRVEVFETEKNVAEYRTDIPES